MLISSWSPLRVEAWGERTPPPQPHDWFQNGEGTGVVSKLPYAGSDTKPYFGISEGDVQLSWNIETGKLWLSHTRCGWVAEVRAPIQLTPYPELYYKHHNRSSKGSNVGAI